MSGQIPVIVRTARCLRDFETQRAAGLGKSHRAASCRRHDARQSGQGHDLSFRPKMTSPEYRRVRQRCLAEQQRSTLTTIITGIFDEQWLARDRRRSLPPDMNASNLFSAGRSETMKSHVQVAVIGGGVVGCSVLYHLTKAGWKDVVLIERDRAHLRLDLACGGRLPHAERRSRTSPSCRPIRSASTRRSRRSPASPAGCT